MKRILVLLVAGIVLACLFLAGVAFAILFAVGGCAVSVGKPDAPAGRRLGANP